MRQPFLFALGVALLASALALPAVDFVAADWDRDYAYRTAADGFCADAVDELRAGASPAADGFVVDAASLSRRARTNVRRAVENGSHRVETQSETGGGPFDFSIDHRARGTGCYAVRNAPATDDRYVALVTVSVAHRTDGPTRRLARFGSRVAAVLGALSLLAGLALGYGVHRR